MSKAIHPLLWLHALVLMLSPHLAYALDKAVWAASQTETAGLVSVLNEAPIHMECEVVHIRYYRLHDPDIQVLTTDNDQVDFLHKGIAGVIVTEDGAPSHPRMSGTLLTDELGNELIATETRFNVRLTQYGQDYILERDIFGNPWTKLASRNGVRKFRQFSQTGNLHREAHGDRAPPLRSQLRFDPYSYASSVQSALEWDPWNDTNVAVEEQGDVYVLRNLSAPQSPIVAELPQTSALMVRAVGSTDSGTSIRFEGEQEILGLRFPTNKEQLSRGPDGGLTTRHRVQNIQLSYAEPAKFTSSLDAFFE